MSRNWLNGFVLVLVVLCLAPRCEAKVQLPALVSDGMVLQRGEPLKIGGKATPGEQVAVSFLKKKYRATADDRGDWQVTLPPLKAGGPYVMTVNEIELKNVLVGDVFLCSGQSNMELPVSRVTDLFREEILSDSNPMIRHIKVPLKYDFHAPQSDFSSDGWKELNPEHAMSFSALAYFFAKELYAKTGIPVGLINSSVGGSPVEAWISEEGLKPFPQYLNDKQICESDAYIGQVKALDARRQHLWNVVLYRQDQGLHGATPWYLPECDDSSWKRIDLFDGSWATNGWNSVNGSHWFRKEIDLPASLAGKQATLRMGCMVDADSVYVNGRFVGTTSYQYPPRIYPIPAGLLKEGKNQVTVRLISYSGYPSFVKEKPYKILFGENEISLEGEWRYKQGVAMPSLPGQTFFQYKPEGLYNAMIAPLLNYAVAGVVWYQGESNTGRSNEYESLLTALMKDWRQKMNRPELPFYIVELASFMSPDSPAQAGWSALRKAQAEAVAANPPAALIRNSDLGEWNDIHPLDKKTVGKRVADAVWQQMQPEK